MSSSTSSHAQCPFSSGVLPSSHAAPLSPSSCTLVAVAPALHVVVPLSNSSSLSYPPPTEYIRTSHGLLSSTGGEGEEEDGSADGESEDGLKKRAEGEEEDDLERRLSREKPKRADAGRSTGEEAKTSDRTSPGAGQAAQRRPGDMSFLGTTHGGLQLIPVMCTSSSHGSQHPCSSLKTTVCLGLSICPSICLAGSPSLSVYGARCIYRGSLQSTLIIHPP